MKSNHLRLIVSILVVLAGVVVILLLRGSIHNSTKKDFVHAGVPRPKTSANALCNELDAQVTSHFGILSGYKVDGKQFQCRIPVGKPSQNFTQVLYTLEGNTGQSKSFQQLEQEIDASLQASGWAAQATKVAGYTYQYVLAGNHSVHATVHVLNADANLVQVQTAIDDSYLPANPNDAQPQDIVPTNRVERLMP